MPPFKIEVWGADGNCVLNVTVSIDAAKRVYQEAIAKLNTGKVVRVVDAKGQTVTAPCFIGIALPFAGSPLLPSKHYSQRKKVHEDQYLAHHEYHDHYDIYGNAPPLETPQKGPRRA